MDTISAYFKRLLGQNKRFLINMKIPPEYRIGQKGLVCKVFKSLYGFKQAGRLQNKMFINFFRMISFISTNADSCILAYQQGDIFILIGVYINNLALLSQSQDGLN